MMRFATMSSTPNGCGGRVTGRGLLAVCLVLVGGAGAAHHSPVNFNLETDEFAVTGTIASVSFRNPHSVIELEVQSAAGDNTRTTDDRPSAHSSNLAS